MLYWVVQKIIQQLTQHIVVGCVWRNGNASFYSKDDCRFDPYYANQKAKSESVVCERHLILDTKVNQVYRNSQGESSLFWEIRNGLAAVNGS